MNKKDFLELLEKDIGYTEYPPNSNNNKFGIWWGSNNVPWCMMSVQKWFSDSGFKIPKKSASCSELLDWYKVNLPEKIVKNPSFGAIIIFNFGHTGIFIKDNGNGTITTIEGNTSPDDFGSQDNGGGVYKKIRDKSSVKSYIQHIIFEEDEDMDGEEIYKRLNEYLANLPTSDYAKESSLKGVKSKLFSDGDKDGLVDNPKGILTREQLAVVLNRAKMLDVQYGD